MAIGFTLTPDQPFDFDLVANARTHFRGRYGTEAFEHGIYRRALTINGRPALVEVRQRAQPDGTVLEGKLEASTEGGKAAGQISALLGVHNDPTPFLRMADHDTALTAVASAFRGLRQSRVPTVFEALVHAILGQQISWQVAASLRQRMVAAFGEPVPDEHGPLYTYPAPERVAKSNVDALRGLGLSTNKTKAILGIAEAIVSGDLDGDALANLPPPAAHDRLLELPGVGGWTAQWVAIQTLDHPDAMPFSDIALQRALQHVLSLSSRPSAEEAREISESWSPHRSLVTVYLFAAMRSGKLTEILEAGR